MGRPGSKGGWRWFTFSVRVWNGASVGPWLATGPGMVRVSRGTAQQRWVMASKRMKRGTSYISSTRGIKLSTYNMIVISFKLMVLLSLEISSSRWIAVGRGGGAPGRDGKWVAVHASWQFGAEQVREAADARWGGGAGCGVLRLAPCFR